MTKAPPLDFLATYSRPCPINEVDRPPSSETLYPDCGPSINPPVAASGSFPPCAFSGGGESPPSLLFPPCIAWLTPAPISMPPPSIAAFFTNPPLRPPPRLALRARFFLASKRFFAKNLRTPAKSVTIFRGFLNQRIPSISVPIPNSACPNPNNFSHQLVSSDKSLYSPSIALTTPNLATENINLTTFEITSIIVLTFFWFLGSLIHFNTGMTIAILRISPKKPSSPKLDLGESAIACTKFFCCLPALGSLYLASNLGFFFASSKSPSIAALIPFMDSAMPFRDKPILFRPLLPSFIEVATAAFAPRPWGSFVPTTL